MPDEFTLIPVATIVNNHLAMNYRESKEASDLIFEVFYATYIAGPWHTGSAYVTDPVIKEDDYFYNKMQVQTVKSVYEENLMFLNLVVIQVGQTVNVASTIGVIPDSIILPPPLPSPTPTPKPKHGHKKTKKELTPEKIN